jgi:hypothetical protein
MYQCTVDNKSGTVVLYNEASLVKLQKHNGMHAADTATDLLPRLITASTKAQGSIVTMRIYPPCCRVIYACLCCDAVAVVAAQ